MSEPRTLANVLADLAKPPAGKHLRQKKQGGSEITFMPHYNIRDYLDHYAPGWEWDVEITVGHERLFMVGRLTLHASDGSLTRCATGTETLVQQGRNEGKQHAFGDPSSNAEAMCLRRAAMAFGFCRDLWRK